MKTNIIIIIIVILAVILAVWLISPGNEETIEDNLIRNVSIESGDAISSPLEITGEARGNWYFEASFPVRVVAENGTELGVAPAQAEGEWMTTEFVPFSVKVNFSPSQTEMGFVILEKSNPSGLPEHADERRIPIQFSQTSEQTRQINLYYYNPAEDMDETGNIACSEQGLVAVNREIPLTGTPIQDTIKLLINGELTDTEKSAGLTTEYPLPSFELLGANLESGQLTLTFADPESQTSGGSCRVSILRNQIINTALQFDEVDEVIIEPEELFQP